MLETERRRFVFFLGLCCAMVAVKFLLLHDQRLIVSGDARYDSRLFIDLAHSISRGQWFGPYNERTLIKGPFYPLWIAAVHRLHVPLLTAQHGLYLAGCGAAAYALARPLGPWGAFFLFTALWFHPTSYALHTRMVMREYVSTSLALLVTALTLLLFQDGAETRRRGLRALGLGLCLGAFWLTREEALWILPFYGAAALHFMLRQVGRAHHRTRHLIKNTAWALIPLALAAACVTVVAHIHRAHYGIAETVELKSRFFRDAYGALTRVKPQVRKPAVPVHRDVRERLYAVSSSFRELRPFLEREDSAWICTVHHLKRRYKAKALDEVSKKGIDFVLENDVSGVWRGIWNKADTEPCDFYGPWFVWAFREAAAAAGHHHSALAAKAYYERLSREIHAACDRKELPCGPARSSLAPPWRWDLVRPWLAMFTRIGHLAASFQGFQIDGAVSTGSAEAMALFQTMTREEIMPPEMVPSMQPKSLRLGILERTATLYGAVFPWVFYAALVVHFYLSFFKRALLDPFWGFATAVLASCAALAALLAYVHVTSFPGIEPRYLAPLPPLCILYAALVFLCAVKSTRARSGDNELDPRRSSC